MNTKPRTWTDSLIYINDDSFKWSLISLIYSTCANPYLSSNLIAALANLEMYNFPHFVLLPRLRISNSDRCKKFKVNFSGAFNLTDFEAMEAAP